MSAAVFSIILFAALLHATWNAIVKQGSDTFLTAILIALSAGAVSLVSLPFLTQPAPASWPFLLFSTALQVAYYFLVAATYRAADMSQAYPLMRGSAPLIVAAASALWLHEPLSATAWAGIAVLSLGIIGMAFASRRVGDFRGVILALANAVVIAGYTLSDGWGVRLSGSPAAYTMWLCVLTAIPLLAWVLTKHASALYRYLPGNLHLGLIGGVGTLASYGLALWAMTLAPVAVVAALRETAILFATAIAVFVLKERVSAARLIAVAVIAIGAGILRLA